jgi:hypothetical protein
LNKRLCIEAEGEESSDGNSYNRWKIDGSNLTVDFSKPIKEKEMMLQVHSIGEVFNSIKLKINVCGYETIDKK